MHEPERNNTRSARNRLECLSICADLARDKIPASYFFSGILIWGSSLATCNAADSLSTHPLLHALKKGLLLPREGAGCCENGNSLMISSVLVLLLIHATFLLPF